MIRLTAAMTADLLRLCVQERGADYVYDSVTMGSGGAHCTYWTKEGAPGCIVGQALDYAGLDRRLATVRLPEGEDLSGGAGTVMMLFEWLRGWNLAEADAASVALLNYAQSEQDQGVCWGDAVRRAIWSVNATRGLSLSEELEPRVTLEKLLGALEPELEATR